ncbi:MAG: efflux RND transporter periplasmic adaptor subunit [Cellvibrionaceae bacterium]|nr:efflux RND transporter periplasmic adaptor subunit [Cellvibrionaceae bacterium]
MFAKSRRGLYCCVNSLAFVSFVIITTLSLSACNGEPETPSAGPLVRPVIFIKVAEAEASQVNQFPAVIEANQLSELAFQVGGVLQELPVNESQQLNRGELIAKLDQRDLKSSRDSATAQFQVAESEYQRALSLSKTNAIAASVLQQRKTEFDVSKAQLERAEKALADSVLRAPFDGVVAQKQVENLQTVSPGQVVVSYMSADTLEATIDMPASFIANVPKDAADREDRQAFVILDAAPNQLIEAKFKEANLLADTASQTYAITFAFRPPESLLILPGMNATVELRFESQTEGARVAVPLAAVSNDGENNYVWAIDLTAMTVSKRNVSLEQGVGKMVVVTSGLDKSDTIVGAGAAYLSEGMQIREWK